jgi:hypothetical protein
VFEVGAEAVEGFEPVANLRQKRTGFFAGIVPVKTETHGLKRPFAAAANAVCRERM